MEVIQFDDDTVQLGKTSLENAKTMKGVLRLFKIVSGLKVNIMKISLYGVNVSMERVDNFAVVVGCKSASYHLLTWGYR